MMAAYDGIRHLARSVRELPGIRHYRANAYARRFASATNVNLYRGVFDTFEAAAASSPPTKPAGYDNDASAGLYAEDLEPYLKDYPAALWLERAFGEGAKSVFDLGGHFGVKYYALASRLSYPGDLRWTVCDVPAVTRRGAEIAAERDRGGHLRFTTEYGDLDGQDVLYASGSIQYLPTPLGDILGRLGRKPRRLIINTAAIHPNRTFYTLNSIGTAFCPYRVMSERDFVGSMEVLGYRMRDRWETPKDFVIPFEKGYDLDSFKGYCFDLEASAAR